MMGGMIYLYDGGLRFNNRVETLRGTRYAVLLLLCAVWDSGVV